VKEDAADLIDAFGGKLTICVLSYGDHPGLLTRFLTQLYAAEYPGVFQLRIGLNAPCDESLAIAKAFERMHPDVTIFHSSVNLFKNPMMRRMFYDPPIESEWTVWFDDDSYVKRADWLMRLALKIEREPEIDQWGVEYGIFPNDEALRFAKSSHCYRGLPWLARRNGEGVDSPYVVFATGGFWVAKTRVLRALDWPDTRLVLAGEDFLLGEALRQNGFQIGSFDRCIAVSAADRRNALAKEVVEIPRD
jgi:GT2 family glycosyltransferase